MILRTSLKKLANHAIIAAVAILAGSSCSTDVDLLAPYKSTPVIYGILEASADTQWVRINRTYLGEGNLNSYAQIKDSLEYDPSQIDARVHKIEIESDDTVATFTLDWTNLDMREEGAFYDENIQMWYFTDQLLSENENGEDFTFTLEVNIDGKRYTGETSVLSIDQLDINQPNISTQLTVNLGNYSDNTNTESYNNQGIEVNHIANSGLYDFRVLLNYDYATTAGEIDSSRISIPFGETSSTGDAIEVELRGERFFQLVGSRLDTIPDLQSIRIKELVFEYIVANDDLATYISVNNPLFITFSQPPEYSNIDGALGIFGSRVNYSLSKEIRESTIDLLNRSQYTGAYCFCTAWEGLYICGSATGCE